MSIGLPDIKLLWGRAGGLCSMCQIKLSEDKASSSDAYPFGEQAHIVAEEEGGPRGKSPLTLSQRNSYPNLILLCPTHHTKIDKAPDEYPVELLHQLKSEHELWFEKSRLSAADKAKQAADYVYAELVDSAAKLCMFAEWERWTSCALSVSPQWKKEWIRNVEEYQRRVLRSVWPKTLPELEDALQTLSLNLAMAVSVFCRNSESQDDEWLVERRDYRNAPSEETYNRMLEAYEAWIDEQYSCIYAATKAANWVATVVRRDLNPMFFAVPGKFVITYGPDEMLRFVTRVLEYSEEERKTALTEAKKKAEAAAEAREKKRRIIYGE